MTSDTLAVANPPRLATGVELLGRVRDSGFADPPSLFRRTDGQVIQLSPMMYLVASLLNDSSDVSDIAVLASAELGRTLTAEQVTYLITARLAPLGIVASRDVPVALPTASPLLALRARVTLLPSAAASVAGTLLRPMFRWPVMAAVLASVGVLDYWILSVNGLGAAFRQLLNNPADLLVVGALALASALFHECGHAAACRYGGARPGRIGVGIYLVWPAFFTNVTDSYRLSRAGRLRTDLGGLYFNLIFILMLAGAYATTTPARILLLVIALTHLEMLEQLLPSVRFDGYFIVSDLVGVPDLFARVAPVLRSTLSPGRRPDAAADGLRRKARIVITSWVLTVVPLLGLTLVYLLLHLPEVNRALWHSTAQAAQLTSADFRRQRYTAAVVAAAGVALAAVSMAGMVYVAVGLLRRAVALGGRCSAGRPWRRAAAVVAATACAGGLTLLWLAQGQFGGW